MTSDDRTGQHRAAGARANRAGRDRRADDLDDQSRDGRRARVARRWFPACLSPRTTAFKSCGPPGAMGPTSADGERRGSSAGWRRWRSARSAPRSERRSPATSTARHCVGGAVIPARRRRRRGGGHFCSGDARYARRAARRAAAASAVWMMMIFGFAITAPLAGHFLDPFSNARLIAVTATVSAIAFLLATLAVWGVEGALEPTPGRGRGARAKPGFAAALRAVGRAGSARLHDIHLRLDARLQRPGTAGRAFRRPGVRHDARRDDKARRTCSMAAC